MPNYVKPIDLIETAVVAGTTKCKLSFLDMFVRGLYSGFLLGGSASLASLATSQTTLSLTGALLFPCGFSLIVLYGFELVTGNMVIIPIALMARRASKLGALKSFCTVYVANFLGTALFLAFYYGGLTQFGYLCKTYPCSVGAIGPVIISTGQGKTITYEKAGVAGWFACFFKAILCNFFVSFAALGALVSTSAVGKIVSLWLPVLLFAALGFEHVVVNMFIVPMSMTLGSMVSWGQWWLWSLLPATLGNLFGAMVMVAVPYWITWGHEFRKKAKLEAEKVIEVDASPEKPVEEAEPEPEIEPTPFTPLLAMEDGQAPTPLGTNGFGDGRPQYVVY